MTNVIGSLTSNARLFASLGAKYVKVRLFESYKLVPFARVAIIPTLALIGALACYPIMVFDTTINLKALLSEVLITLVAIIMLLFFRFGPFTRKFCLKKSWN